MLICLSLLEDICTYFCRCYLLLQLFEDREPDRLKRGANLRTNAADNFGRPMNPMMPMGVEKFERRPEGGVPVAKKEPKEPILRRWNPVDGRDVGDRDQVENPMAIAEPHLRQDEENQVDMH